MADAFRMDPSVKSYFLFPSTFYVCLVSFLLRVTETLSVNLWRESLYAARTADLLPVRLQVFSWLKQKKNKQTKTHLTWSQANPPTSMLIRPEKTLLSQSTNTNTVLIFPYKRTVPAAATLSILHTQFLGHRHSSNPITPPTQVLPSLQLKG